MAVGNYLGGIVVAATALGMVDPGPAPVAGPSTPAVQQLQRWMPGTVRCGGRTIAAAGLKRPYTSLQWIGTPPAPQTFRFRVDADGRPVTITRVSSGWVAGSDDIAPSLAASKLPAGSRAEGCEVTYTADPKPLAEAPVEDLVSYTLTPLNGRLPEAGWQRIRPAGGDCDREPRAHWLTAVSPDYARLPADPGVRDWSLVAYDLDAKGRPVGARHVTGTGNAVLDRAAVKALAASRQTEGPRHGCLNPYVRRATRLPAPADLDTDALRPAGATCGRDDAWATKPVLTYPEAWRRRAIEGWAIVAYDVAPWGGTGNVRVVASEPAAEFGERAVQIIAAAKKPASPAGATGCVERVRFVMGPGTFDADLPG